MAVIRCVQAGWLKMHYAWLARDVMYIASTFRKIKSIDQTAFAKEVQHRLNTKDISKINAEECIDIYHNILKTTLDNHAPLKSKVTSDRPKMPWYSDEIGEAIHRHHNAE